MSDEAEIVTVGRDGPSWGSLERFPAMAYSMDSAGRIEDVSDDWLAGLGYTRDAVIGRPANDFMTPASRRRTSDALLPNFQRTGECRDIAFEFLCNDGRILDCLLSASSERGHGEHVLRTLVLLTDVSERNRAIGELAGRDRSRNRYARAVESVLALAAEGGLKVDDCLDRLIGIGLSHFGLEVGIVANLVDGMLVVRNAQGESPHFAVGASYPIEGTFSDQVLKTGRPVCVSHLEESDLNQHAAYQRFRSESYIGAEIRVDGRVFGTLAFSSTQPRSEFSNADSALIQLMAQWAGFRIMISEQRERQRREFDLRAAAELNYRQLLELLPDGIFINCDGQLVFANRAAASLAGVENPEQLIGAATFSRMPPDDVAIGRWRHAKVLAEKCALPAEDQWRTRTDGSPIVVENVTAYTEWEGRPAVIAVNRDATGRIEAQREIVDTLKRLEAANQQLRQFVFIASHDLQEPMRKIETFVRFLEEEHEDSLDEQASQYVHVISDAAARMRRLIADVLDLARLDGDVSDHSKVDLHSLINKIIVDFSADVEAAGGTVQIDSLPDVRGDAAQIDRLFRNLIENALRFRAPDRPLRIVVSARLVGSGGSARQEIVITDNGIGFPQSAAREIFQPFKKLNPMVEERGSGMGLAICSRIADLHEGAIFAKSAEGEGASFSVRLPLA